MQKIDFGYENSMNPKGIFEGIGISSGSKGAVSGEFLGVFQRDGMNYLVARTTMAFKGEGIGQIVVRRALADLYHDGYGNLFIDQLCSEDCKKFETLLNSNYAQNQLNKGTELRDICGGCLPSKSFECVTKKSEYVSIIAVAIRHEVFEEKRSLLGRSRLPMSEMQRKIEALEAMLAQAREENTRRGR